MSSEAVLVEWMDILSSAEAKVREFFFEKTFSRFVFDECLSPWFPLYSFFFSISPGDLISPLCVCSTWHMFVYIRHIFGRVRTAVCSLGLNFFFTSFGFILLALY